MPDITMCRGVECIDKFRCYRYMATPTPHWQSYFANDNMRVNNECEQFWSVKDRMSADKIAKKIKEELNGSSKDC